MIERLAVLLGLAFVALALANSTTTLVAGIGAVALAAVLASRYAAISIRSHVVTVGTRAHEHRESFSSIPEPSHPDTAGRTRSRAPSQSPAAA
jgi:hypothetical protein